MRRAVNFHGQHGAGREREVARRGGGVVADVLVCHRAQRLLKGGGRGWAGERHHTGAGVVGVADGLAAHAQRAAGLAVDEQAVFRRHQPAADLGARAFELHRGVWVGEHQARVDELGVVFSVIRRGAV